MNASTRRPFIHSDFLLTTDWARRLFHEVAKDLPIIDYHSHLPADRIATDHRFRNLAEIWLEGDHYKWRALRTDGVDERLITGDAGDWEKFEAWADALPRLLRNPLYHWTHLELRRPLGIDDALLSPATAREIWERANARLAEPAMSCRGILKRMNVVLVCTTDDPVDSLEHHRAIAADRMFGVKVLPTWRPDKALAVGDPAAWNRWVAKLEAAAGVSIGDYDDFLEALERRHEFFHANGGRLADQGLESLPAAEPSGKRAAAVFLKARKGTTPTPEEAETFRSTLLLELAAMNHARGWTQQLHLGAMRNNNTMMLKRLGPDSGYDSISDAEQARPLAAFLDRLERTGRLTKTILYNLNPRDNALMATMAGNFQGGGVPGRIQWGSGWWFLDQLDGMRAQIETLSQMGLLSRFVGMLTDSRSFLSFTRHEYFRRMLCGIIGEDIEKGLIPPEWELVAPLVRDVCHDNAVRYFGFDLPLAAERITQETEA